MKKRSVLSFIAVMIMSAAISGCSTSAATDGKVNAEAADSENNGAAGTEADSGEYAYVIGHYGGITGSVATAGVNGYNGIKLCIKQWNEKGGVLGGQIKLEFYDDGATTEGAVKGVSYLIDNCHVDGIIGSQLSGNIESTGDLVEASEVPEVATGMNPAWLEKGWTYLFRSVPNSSGGAEPQIGRAHV